MLKKVNPAVVNISTLTTKKVNNPMFDDPFFRHFFGGPNNRQFPPQERKLKVPALVLLLMQKKVL